MSYSNIKNLEEIKNKKVLFYDLETTGIIKTDRDKKPEEEYPNYKELEKYDKVRIVSIGWLYMKDYDYNYEIGIENISEQIIKPEGFKIPEEAIKIHGITNEIANEKGKELKKMLKKIGKIIKECEYIIGYNVYYDINVLLSELYRKKRSKTIKKILKLKKEKKIICMGQISSKEAKPNKFYKYAIYAIPSQKDVYERCYNEELLNAHNAKSDVLGMIKIMYWIYENKIEEKYKKITGIKEFENLEVSNFGNVRIIYSQNLLKGQIYEKGRLYEYNKKRIYAHELVALNYLPKPEGDKILIHLDKDTLNNNITNLQWIEKTEINTKENHGKKCDEIEIKKLKDIIKNHEIKYGEIISTIKKLVENKKITEKEVLNYLPKLEGDKILSFNILSPSNLQSIEKSDMNNEENHGKKWEEDEINELIKEVKEKKKLEDIIKNHKRKNGGIISAIKKLFENKKITEKEASFYKIIISDSEKKIYQQDNVSKLEFVKNKKMEESELMLCCGKTMEIDEGNNLYSCDKCYEMICIDCHSKESKGEIYFAEGDCYCIGCMH
jgi:hypothetical protein